MTTFTLNRNHTGDHMPEQSLTNFLLARIAEDEAIAQAVSHETAMAEGRYSWASVDFNDIANAEHGGRWTPSRVLAECETKRQIIAAYLDVVRMSEATPGISTAAAMLIAGKNMLETVLEALTLPYADHADYQPEWRLPPLQTADQ